ncbi:MAG: hypothetical protein LUI12_10995 [Clostridiales bacterium]|nr:hypothetical protein [Clostridiales bacterium]
MRLGFDTDSMTHAKAALLVYALYRSRDKQSPLNGLETWSRMETFIRGSCLKSDTTAEFCDAFCRKAKIESIKPRYFKTDEPIPLGDGTFVTADGIDNYRPKLLADDDIRRLLERESMYIILLVRDRIQREKIEGAAEDYEEN